MKWYSNKKIYLRKIHIFFVLIGINIKKTFYFKNIFKFLLQLRKFKKKGGKINSLYPVLEDYDTSFNNHKNQFFHADLYISQKIFDENPPNHIDIGSRVDGLVGHLASFRELDVLELRSVDISPHKNINFIRDDITKIKNKKNENKYISISSVGVIGHIGLGRYGDSLDPDGPTKAIKSICDLAKENANIYIMVPVGKESIEFNAHRIFNPKNIVDKFEQNNCKLVEFSLVNDHGNLILNSSLSSGENLNFGGGIFVFKKK